MYEHIEVIWKIVSKEHQARRSIAIIQVTRSVHVGIKEKRTTISRNVVAMCSVAMLASLITLKCSV